MNEPISDVTTERSMESVTAELLKHQLQSADPPFLIDVRETWETQAYNIGGVCIPLNSIMQRVQEIPTSKPVVVYCEKGIRSMIAIQKLSAKFGFKNLINLKDGMEGWKKISNK